MAEAVALVASVVAVIQLSERIANICKFYIGGVDDYPKDLRLIYVEVGSLRVLFEGLSFLDQEDEEESTTLRALQGEDGPVERCKEAVEELGKLFPSVPLDASSSRRLKEKLRGALTALEWPLKASTARKLLEGIMKYKSTISLALHGQLLVDVRQIKRQITSVSVKINASEKRKLIDWVRGSALGGASSWRLHDAAVRLYEEGTGDWVFRTPEWDDWVNFRNRAIWLNGIPGAGKTVLVSHVIEAIRDTCKNTKRQICSYYYCYHGHNQDEADPFLRSLVGELLAEQPGDQVPEAAWNIFQRKTSLNEKLLLDLLEQLLPFMERVFVAIDALDESQDRDHLLSLLKTIATEERFSKIQLFASSRQYADIRSNMCEISQSLSMSNPFVEADICVFVAARVRAEPKFRNWPRSLRDEVLETLTVGAKGMFRWTACQLDILRRLYRQSKIREAIKTLPETLDETYERIFSYITNEERELVRHALHMVCFHDFLWSGELCLPARLLLESYSNLQVDGDITPSDDVLCDLAILKDACGCLVTFSRKQSPGQEGEIGEETAIIAHYTVREFLESTRASRKLTEWVSITNSHYSALLCFIFDFALTTKTPALEVPDAPTSGLGPLFIRSTSNLREYCLASSLRSLSVCEDLIKPSLAFRFVDPNALHYEEMQEALEWESWGVQSDFLTAGYASFPFWIISWTEETKSSHAAILTNLLVMNLNLLAEEFISDLGTQADQVMQYVLDGEVQGFSAWYPSKAPLDSCARIQGDVLHVLAQVQKLDKRNFDVIKEVVGSAAGYHDMILFHMTNCGPDTEVSANGSSLDCAPEDETMFHLLLRCGASPDPTGYQVTPLQIACHRRSLREVRLLLEAGADPNNTGDPTGVTWNDETLLLHPFSKLHGTSPIDILVRYEAILGWEDGMGCDEIECANGIVTDEIRRVLLSYGARPSLDWSGTNERGSDVEIG